VLHAAIGITLLAIKLKGQMCNVARAY